MILWRASFALPLAALLATTAPVVARAQAAPAPPQAAAPIPPASAPRPQPDPLALDELDAVTAGESVEGLSSQQLTATNTGNQIAGSVQSGDVTFSQNALSGFSGVGNFVVNTGSNNNLQGAISINIVTAGP